MYDKTVCQNSFKGLFISYGFSGQEGRLKPSPVLVRAFQVKVCRIFQKIIFLKYSLMADAGIKPDIKNILFLAEFPLPDNAGTPFLQG